jgi:glycosyltransferase involved in cell wall biosynthesis
MEFAYFGTVAANLGSTVNRLLAISWAMPPMLAPRALQVPLNLKYLGRLGWDITVVTSNHHPPWKGMRYDPALETRFQNTGYTTLEVDSPERSLFLRALWRYLPLSRPIPDNQRPWSRQVVRAALNILQAVPHGAILTFAVPWSDHLAGLELHRQTGLPWIAHFSDPWVDSPYFTASKRVRQANEELEEAVIREATRVIFVTKQTVELVMKKYPLAWRKKVFVIPHGYDPDQHQVKLPLDKPIKSKFMKLVYAGTFYGLRSPVPLFHALQRLRETSLLSQNIEVQLVGQVPEKYGYQRLAQDLGLNDIVKFTGIMPYSQTQAITAQADVLLVIDAPNLESSVFLPSKLVDYLPFHKPIIGITPLQGSSADLIQRLGCPVASPDDTDAIVRILAELVEAWETGTLNVSAAYSSVALEYDIRNITRQIDTLLREVSPSF